MSIFSLFLSLNFGLIPVLSPFSAYKSKGCGGSGHGGQGAVWQYINIIPSGRCRPDKMDKDVT